MRLRLWGHLKGEYHFPYPQLYFVLVSDGTYNKLGFYDYVLDNLTWYDREKWIGLYKDFNISVQ